MLTVLAITAAGALVCTAVGTGMLRTRAHEWGLVDVPNHRSMHTRVTPRGGGIVLVFAVVIGLVVSSAADVTSPALVAAFAGVTLLVAAIGWRDDRRSLPASARLLTHIIAAAAAMLLWGTFDRVQLPYSGEIVVPATVAAGITGLWLVGMLNAYNFMDGIDGIAAGQAVVAGAMWVLICGASAPLATAAGALIAAASFGFLLHNWSPARIFMGDAGSGFLGFSFALVPLAAYHATGDPRLPVAGVLVQAPFVFDTLFTLVRRSLRGENLLQAHRSHLYQRLVTGGFTHRRTAALYLGLSVASGIAAVVWIRGASDGIVMVPVAALILLPLLTASVEGARQA